MARKSTKFEPVVNEKVAETSGQSIEPMKKTDTVNGPRKVIVAFEGSWTYHSIRYQGVVEFDENDERLTAAKGKYKIIGRK